MNIYCCCLHKVNKLVEIKNKPRSLHPNVDKGKQARMLIPNFEFSNMNIMCYSQLGKMVSYIQLKWYIVIAKLQCIYSISAEHERTKVAKRPL